MRRLWWLCLAACAPGGGQAERPDGAAEPVATAPVVADPVIASTGPLDRTSVICDRAVRCGTIGRTQQGECRKGPGASRLTLVWGSSDMLGIPDLVANRRLIRDPEASQRCLEKLATAPCRWDRSAPRDDCDSQGDSHAPAVAPGGVCTRWDECVDGFCTAQPGCTGVCVARSPRGGPCHENQLCRDDEYCHEGRCAPRAGVGEPCGGHWQWCQDGLFCDGYVAANDDDHAFRREQPGRCSAGRRRGEDCAPPEHVAGEVCGSGLFCDWGGERPVCSDPLAEGAQCRWIDACADGLVCAGLVLAGRHPAGRRYAASRPGRCTRSLDDGDACDPDAFVSGCPAAMTCDPQRRVCRSTGHVGDPCTSSWISTPQRDDVPPRTQACNSAHYCDVATRTCKLQLPLGARCEPVASGVEDSPCFLGDCDPKTRKCAAKCPRR